MSASDPDIGPDSGPDAKANAGLDSGAGPTAGAAGDAARASHPSAADDFRRMAPTYAAVVFVELMVLGALWWFQRSFS
jgi:hypothetical protein